ncbi:MAG: hypothetical protein JXQ81_11065 [Desulfuromonadales bacterium]|nr:hypothetical protein [Desulfuromonadales bacterium]
MRHRLIPALVFGICCLTSAAIAATGPSLPGDDPGQTAPPVLRLASANGSVSGSVSETLSTLHYENESLLFNAQLGLGYRSPDWGEDGAQGLLGLGTVFGDSFAIGGLLSFNRDSRDAVVNTLWETPVDGLRFKGSIGYLWGEQDFDFLSGKSTQDLSQTSWLLGADMIFPATASNLGLQRLGINVWGAKADQKSDDAPVYFMVETATSYTTYIDSLKLSEGQLTGISLDTQYAVFNSVVLRGAIGYETLEFPYSDGTEEKDEKLYGDLSLFWQPVTGLVVETGWKYGVSGDLYRVNLTKGSYQLSSWYNRGRNGLEDESSVMLSYRFRFGHSEKPAPLAISMRPSGQSNLLHEALIRPTQLPQTFLAKVDETAVRADVVVDKAGLAGAASVDNDGDIHIALGSTPTITGVTRNSSSYLYSGIIEEEGAGIVIHTSSLPEGIATYYINVTAGGALTIKVETE